MITELKRIDLRKMESDPPDLIERFKRGVKFDVTLDGKPVPYSFYADVESGTVRAYSPDPATGQLRVCTDHTTVGEVELKGKVTIKRQPFAGNRPAGDQSVQGLRGQEAPDNSMAAPPAAGRSGPVYGR